GRGSVAGPGAGLDLDEREDGTVLDYEVEFAVSAAPVSGEHHHPQGFEKLGREILTSCSHILIASHVRTPPCFTTFTVQGRGHPDAVAKPENAGAVDDRRACGRTGPTGRFREGSVGYVR